MKPWVGPVEDSSGLIGPRAVPFTPASGPAAGRKPGDRPGNGLPAPAALSAGRTRDLRHMRAFYRISLLGTSRGSPAEIAARVLREFALVMGFRRAEICLLDRARRLRRLSSYGSVPAGPDDQGVPLRDCRLGWSLLRRRQAVLHSGQEGGAARRRICHVGWGRINTLFGVALRGPDGPLGLVIADRGGRRFEMSATDLEIATALAGLISEVMKGALARTAEIRRRDGLLLLNHVGRAISAEESLPVLLPRLAAMVREASRALGVVVALHDETTSELEVVAIAGPRRKYYQGFRFPARLQRNALSPRVLRSGRPALIDDLRKTPDICAYWPEARSALVIPIRSKAKTLGTLRLEESRPHAFDEEDTRLHVILGDQIGNAIRRARVIETLNRKQSDLRAVSESLETRLEEDRRRIARELHDELAQSMTAARINLGLLRKLTRGDTRAVHDAIQETEAVVLRTIEETRRIAMDLRPSMLDELGLLPALRWYADTFARRTGIGVEVQADGAGGTAHNDLNTLLFRFFQEALTNVARHAHARKVRIGLTRVNGTLKAVVSDDGAGMKQGGPPPRGLGLLGMRERIERAGGALRILSRPGRGTRLVAEIPARSPGPARRRPRPASGEAVFLPGGFA